MKHITILYLVPLVAVLLTSCDNRKEYLDNLSPVPTLRITDLNGNGLDRDSVKLTLKSSKQTSTFLFNVNGNNSSKQVTADIVNGKGILSMNGQVSPTVSIGNGNYRVSYKPSTYGTTLLNFTLKDNFDKMSSGRLEVVAFENLPPMAKLTYVKTGVTSSLEYKLDASLSIDKDAAYGGHLVNYKFTINGKTIQTQSPSIVWTFGDVGNYNLGVTVWDNDGDSSSVMLPPVAIQ